MTRCAGRGIFPYVLLMLSAVCGLGVSPEHLAADEGMWLFNQPPRELLGRRHGFEPSEAWLARLRAASVRFNSGGSGAFVSPEGLVMTNHHVGADALQKLGTSQRNLLEDGFFARTRDEELRCVDLELNVLMDIEDVSERIQAAVAGLSDPAAATRARTAAMNTIEKESFERTGLRSDVVTLYQGARYHLYRYKKYTDVRLVFAPEQDVAFFGGDVDNFEYPRHDFDVCFFRVYENGRPAPSPDYLPFSISGVRAGQLVLVSGHPGRTDRFDTLAELEFQRDVALPLALQITYRREVLLSTYSQRGAEHARRAADELFGLCNRRKALRGRLEGLRDPRIIEQKRSEEQSLRNAVAGAAKLGGAVGAWDEAARAVRALTEIHRPWLLLERAEAFDSRLFDIARGIVRLVEETAKPNADRLREYRDSNLDSLRESLFSAAPIHGDFETLKLADSLDLLAEMAAAGDDEVLKRLAAAVLDGRSPRQRAAELVEGTRLVDVTFRRRLAEGGAEALAACDDPMIRLARLVDRPARSVRKVYEQRIEEPLRQAHGKLAEARFALGGEDVYPDATFTLRLAFGTVAGYREAGRDVPPWTTLGDLFARSAQHGHQPPFRLPQRWLDARQRLRADTPLNFVCTADITGGNSGSPVVDRDGRLVGVIFDGNLDSLVWDYAYSDETGRAIAVDARAIVEALDAVYHAGSLVDELLDRKAAVTAVATPGSATGSATGPATAAAATDAAAPRTGVVAPSPRADARASVAAAESASAPPEQNTIADEARAFMDRYLRELAELDRRANLAQWKAANSGTKEDFDAAAEAALALKKFHSDPGGYAEVRRLLAASRSEPARFTEHQRRSLELAELAYRANQLDPDHLARMVELSTEINRIFNTYRARIGERTFTNNELLDVLRDQRDSRRREEAWTALKQVGGAVAPKLLELARIRNEAARRLGFKDFWDMQIRLQEHDPDVLLPLFDELDRLTREPFLAAKAEMDRHVAEKLGLRGDQLMPWHYDNPFFQAAPSAGAADLDVIYRGKAKEQIVEIARRFFAETGLPVDDILRRSDLYEREGKDQHAFSTSIDRSGDVRILCNIEPTAEWMDTTLHELGHAIYDERIERSLPYNLREPAHAFTTEGVAMLFGALGNEPGWMQAYAGASPEKAKALAEAARRQRRWDQLIFARWTLVMLHFERALYENPEQDLNRLWWDMVERYQHLRRPPGRNEPDWAAKPHFTIAPVYYHNYMLGELFAAQLRAKFRELNRTAGRPEADLSFVGRKDFGEYLERNVFAPGASWAWPEFVRRATGQPLSARWFAEEVAPR